jgi:hypothetical protein
VKRKEVRQRKLGEKGEAYECRYKKKCAGTQGNYYKERLYNQGKRKANEN